MINVKSRKKQSGVALIQVLLITAIITVMALRLSYNARNQVSIAATFEQRAQAQLKLSSAQAGVLFTLLTENTDQERTKQNASQVAPQWNYYGKPFDLEPGVTVKINDHRGLIPQRLPSSTLWEDFLTREEVNEQQQKLMLARLNDWQYQNRVTANNELSALKTTEKGIAYPFRSIQLPQEVSFIFPNELHQQLQELTSHYAYYTFNPLNAFAVDTKTASAANAQTYGSEALTSALVANDGTVLTLGGVVLTAGAQYSVGDIITVTIDGGKFANTAYTLTDTPATNNDALTFGLLNKTDTTLTFRVTALTSGTNNSTIGNTFALAGSGGTGIAANGVVLTSTSAKAAVNVTAKAETSTGIKIDSTSNDTVKIGEVIAEHSLAVDPVMDAIIDVTKLRKEFKDATKAKFVVKHTYTSADQANFEDAAAKIKYMVNGSMVGYSDTTAFDGKLTDGSVDYVVAADKESASTTYTQNLTTAALADKTLTFTVGTTDAKREVLAAGKYTVTGSITIGTKSIDLGTKAAGEMKLNGSSFDLSYVPYGDSVEQFIWVTNKGTLAGEITVTGFDQNGETYGPYDLGTVEGGKLAKLDADLKAKLVADGVTNERVSLNVTVNAPTGNVEVFAAYKVISANDRLTLPVKSLN